MGAAVTPPRRLVGAALGLGLDRMFGEPPTRWHPLVYFGRLMGAIEGRIYRDERAAGVGYAGAGLALGVLAGRLVTSSTLATALSVGGRSLASSATAVATPLEAGDLDAARDALTALVGRDPRDLDATEVARAVVESLAENTVDAIVAPALFAAAFGARGALGYRAINTMDAMVGHRSDRYRRFGTAAARLDDVANWIPSRVTAALVVLVRPRAAWSVFRAVRDQAPDHPSPNSGVAEAAFAAALGLTLGGRNVYGDRVEVRPPLGTGRPAQARDIEAARRLSRDVTAALGLVLVGVATLVARRRSREASWA
ncbi:MAG: adenosylcobinamide-phosphate synthase CbiB [Acidimicrobiales bacterium]